MKMSGFVILLVSTSAFLSTSSTLGQGTFRNLDFESPIPPLPAGPSVHLPITNGLPGWTGYIGTFQVDEIVYNTVGIGSATISFHGPGSIDPILQGNYSVMLQRQTAGSLTPAIAQTGFVPTGANTLVFFSRTFASFQVTFAGQLIPLVQLGSGPNYDIAAGDISAFAGQMGELRFTGSGVLDNIQFSTLAIPEPRVIALSALGAVLLGWLFRRQRRT